MTPEYAIELIKNMMFTALLLVSPVLLMAMSIGLAVSVFQSVTSINEQTLTFFPKLVGIGGLLVVTLPWMLRTAMEFTIDLIQRMPDMVR